MRVNTNEPASLPPPPTTTTIQVLPVQGGAQPAQLHRADYQLVRARAHACVCAYVCMHVHSQPFAHLRRARYLKLNRFRLKGVGSSVEEVEASLSCLCVFVGLSSAHEAYPRSTRSSTATAAATTNNKPSTRYEALFTFTRLMAPLAPFFAEFAYQLLRPLHPLFKDAGAAADAPGACRCGLYESTAARGERVFVRERTLRVICADPPLSPLPPAPPCSPRRL